MSAWLDPLRRALESASSPVTFFLRDDDAGWCDDRLFDLLELVAYHGVPIDIAVIPEALSFGLARRLRDRIEATPGQVEVHQHGFAHVNHEPTGRKCEFGLARSSEDQRRDLDLGRRRLTELVGADVRPIFTPPWNRCTGTTGACLVELGFWILSRDRSAEPLAIPGLVELPISVDWFAKSKGVRVGRDELGQLLAAAIRSSGPIGIMFHHALMDSDELDLAGELLGLLESHTAAQCRTMLALGSHTRLGLELEGTRL